MATNKTSGIIGLGVDSTGNPVVDPTANVISLTEAANKRQDDLREASDKYNASQILHAKELATLHSSYAEKLSTAEAKRIDAIRAVDVNAVAIANERQAASATVLANQVSQSADALRTLVATTAATYAEQQRQLMTQVNDRLTAVERSQYEGRGKEAISDPMMAELVAEMKRVTALLAVSNGKSVGTKAFADYIGWGIAALLGLFALAQYLK